jgi:hypothetical protein
MTHLFADKVILLFIPAFEGYEINGVTKFIYNSIQVNSFAFDFI